MAYQNVGTPRFYTNAIEFLESNGYLSLISNTSQDNPDVDFHFQGHEVYRTLPVGSYDREWGWEMDIDPIDIRTLNQNSFIAVLGHTTNEFRVGVNGSFKIFSPIINSGGNSIIATPEYHGFSIAGFDGTDATSLSVRDISNPVGSVIIGTYYDMPHSPDLNLTMTREMSGANRVRTKGGSDLVNYKYKRPLSWGNAAPWELYEGNPPDSRFSRSGRRIWDLSFSYINNKNVFPMINSITARNSTSADGDVFSSGDTWHEGETLLDSNTFYSQVIHRTNGNLPFIFQPNNSHASDFAICKFDMNSFKFNQIANNVVRFNLKIKEVW